MQVSIIMPPSVPMSDVPPLPHPVTPIAAAAKNVSCFIPCSLRGTLSKKYACALDAPHGGRAGANRVSRGERDSVGAGSLRARLRGVGGRRRFGGAGARLLRRLLR